jgi:uncharacterized delta-60 repeat protein
MFLTPLVSRATALWRARGKSGRAVRAAGKRPHARRAMFERLEVREVLSSFSPVPGVVLASVGDTTFDRATASYLDSDGKIVVAGDTRPTSSAPGQSFAALRFQANGTLDPAFGTAGIVVTPLGTYTSGACAVVEDPTTSGDKILLGGFGYDYVKPNPCSWEDFALARYDSDGSLDKTFNYQQKNKNSATYGTVLTHVGDTWFEFEGISGVLVQPDDGKIVAGGSYQPFPGQGLTQWALVRYTGAGQVDTGFGSAGVVFTDFGGNGGHLSAVTLQKGEILAVGTAHPDGGGLDLALARYNLEDGSLDTSFGASNTGEVLTNVGYYDLINAVAVYPDIALPDGSNLKDSIVVAGYTEFQDVLGYTLILARYSPDGILDSSFGADGIVETCVNQNTRANAVAIQPDGKIVTAGWMWSEAEGHGYLFVARYDTSGNLDTTFGSGTGWVATYVPDLVGQQARSVLIQPDGKIVVSGYGTDAAQRDYIAVARYNTNGTLDTTFGVPPPGITVTPTSGLVTTEAGGTASFSVVLNSQPGVSVTIPVSSSDTTEGTVSVSRLTFTSANWNTPQTVTVTGVDDSIRDGDIRYTVELAPAVSDDLGYSGVAPSDVSVTNKDNEKGKITGSAASAAALTDAALADAGRQQLALAALLQYEDQLQAKPAARSKGLELPAVDLALLDLAS